MDITELSWRAEEACLAAWPAPREILLDGWLLRAAGGGVRRPNSVNPIRNGARDPGAILPFAEAVYRALGQTPLFRVLSLTEGMDEVLAAKGYASEGETTTLYGESAGFVLPDDATAELSAEASVEWRQARARLSNVDSAETRIFDGMLDSILVPKAFAASREEGEIAALAYGTLCNGLAVVESVVTDAAQRRRGHGRRTVARLLRWAKDLGAEAACLQVVADNAAARGLYHGLGFTTELHRYHYRRKA